MLNWRKLLTDFGWAMAMTDPICYSYYLARRVDGAHGKGALEIASPGMEFRGLRDGSRARPTVFRSTIEGR